VTHAYTTRHFLFDSAAICMVATDALENFRAANRRVANVAACQASLESPDAETKRKQAATVVNALKATRARQVSKPTE
jgi:hypothetical protein